MTNSHNMQPKIKQTGVGLLLVILLVYSFTVQATRLNQCNSAMLASETQQISFGDMAPTVGGSVTVSTAGARTATILGQVYSAEWSNSADDIKARPAAHQHGDRDAQAVQPG